MTWEQFRSYGTRWLELLTIMRAFILSQDQWTGLATDRRRSTSMKGLSPELRCMVGTKECLT